MEGTSGWILCPAENSHKIYLSLSLIFESLIQTWSKNVSRAVDSEY